MRRYAKSDNTKQKGLKERIPNHTLHVQFERKISVSQSNLLYPKYGVYVHNYLNRQKMPKSVKMLSIILRNGTERKKKKGGGVEFFRTITPSGAPGHFDWIKLAHAQLNNVFNKIRL